MDRASDGPLRAIQEEVNTVDIPVNESNRLNGLDHTGEILAPHQQVHVLRVSHRLDVDTGNPSGHGIAAHHGMPYFRAVQSRGYATRSLTHGIHGGNHPFPREVFEADGGHIGYSRGARAPVARVDTGGASRLN
jgi:hypothetical protein